MPRKHPYILNPEKTLAILIGIENYEDFAQVDPAPSNVRELAKILSDDQIVGIPPDQVQTIVGGKSAAIKELLFDITEKFRGKGLQTLVLYFVGHGYRRPNGDYYLAAEDSKKRLLRLDGSTGIAYNAIKQIIRESRIPQRLIFLDACYSGSTTLSDSITVEGMALKGTYTITSSDSREVSYFNPEHSHTLFTGELINILRTGLEDGGERIGLDELYGALKRAVRKRNPKMSPQQLGSEEITGGNYLFCRNLLYNAQTEQRAEVVAAIALGDEHLKAREFDQAEYQYLKAKQKAEEYDLFHEQDAALEQRFKKLRYAKELHGEWKDTEGEANADTEEEGQSAPLAFLRSRAGMLIAGVLVLGGIAAAVAFWGGGGSGGQKPNSIAGITDSVQVNPGPVEPLSDAEIIERIAENMVTVEGGSFTMGCTFEQGDDCFDDEKHLNTVNIKTYQLGRFEVTQEEWRAVMGSDPEELRFPGCDRCPVEKVSWREVKAFIAALNEKTGKQYRFPCEAEWEYAARGGSQSHEFKYAGSSVLEKVAWTVENSGQNTHAVGQLEPYELGFYDMSGNVYEWCQDHFHDSYAGAPTNGEAWEHPDSVKRVLRGGSWDHPPTRCRVSNRNFWHPAKRYKDVGIRLAQSI